MEFQALTFSVRNGVGTITLNRPEAMNALNDQLYGELAQLIRIVADDSEVGCVVIAGAGRAFCAGADMKSMPHDMKPLARRQRHRWILSDVVRPLVNLEKPIIAAVNGPAVGAGFNIALAADFIVASESATFSQIFVRLGLVPDLGGLYLLTRIIGLNKAKELCFTGKKIGAAEAHALGIVNHVVATDSLAEFVTALAEQIAAGPPTALAMMKVLLNKASVSTLEQMLEYEGYAQPLAYTTAEHREGVAAFQQKRAPDFRGVKE